MNTEQRRNRHGFTLIELLMVSVVISILLGMLAVGLYKARVNAQNAAISNEINQLTMAIETSKERAGKGAYPPSGGSSMYAYMRQLYPRYKIRDAAALQEDLDNNYSALGLKYTNLDPAEALVFWLAGPPLPKNPNGLHPGLQGFSRAVDTPLANAASISARQEAFFDFDAGRLTDYDNDGWPEFKPNLAGDQPPFVYYGPDQLSAGSGARYPAESSSGISATLTATWGYAFPYPHDRGGPANDGKFQIICAGLDGSYGDTATRSYPSGLTGKDSDNLTNLSNGTLGSQLK